jgi:hypothetical protein
LLVARAVLDLKVERQIPNSPARDVSLNCLCITDLHHLFREKMALCPCARARAFVNSSQIRRWRGSVNILVSSWA